MTGIRHAALLAWLLCAMTLLILAFSLLLILLGWSTPLPQDVTPWRDQAVSLVGLVGAPILGGLVAARRPRNSYGWVWLGFGLGLALQQFATAYAAYALVEPGTLVAPQTVSRVLGLGNQVALGFAPFLFLLFPTGRLPSQRWRPLAWLSALSGATILVLVFLFGSPDKVPGIVGIMAATAVFVIFIAIVFSAVSLVIRYRRAGGIERQQLKWFALAAVLAAFIFAMASVSSERLLGEALWNLLNVASYVCLYTAVGVAILRHRLYDIDRIINRTLVYGVLTVTLLLVYFGVVVSLQRILSTLVGGGNQLAIVASTLTIAALFNPLRHRIQDFIDRRFYRKKYDAARTLETFSARLRDETDLDNLNADVISVVRNTMQPEHVSLWLRVPEHASGHSSSGEQKASR